MIDLSATPRVYLDPSTVARELGISEQALKRLRLSRQIDYYQPTPRRVLFTKEQVEAYKERSYRPALAA